MKEAWTLEVILAINLNSFFRIAMLKDEVIPSGPILR